MTEKFNKIQVLLVIIIILSVVVHFLLVIPKTRNCFKNLWQQHIAKTENDKPKLESISDRGAIESDLAGYDKTDTLTEKAYTNILEGISLSQEEKSAVKIICQEFRDILQKGKMKTSINTIEYWQKVFDNVNHPELFQKGLPYIRIALKPGYNGLDKPDHLSYRQV